MQSRDLLGRSQYYLQNGLFDFAVEISTRLLNDDADLSAALFTRACAYKELNKYQEAIADLNKFIHQKPNLPRGYSLRGLVFALIDGGLSERAFADIQKSMSLAPRNHLLSCHIEELFIHFDKAVIFSHIKALPREVRIQLLEDCLDENTYFGREFKKQRGFNECSIQAGVLRKIHRYHHRIKNWTVSEWIDLGDKKNIQGKFRAAVSAYSEALNMLDDEGEMSNDSLPLYLERGNMFCRLNNMEAAINDYDSVICIDAYHVGAHINRAAILSMGTAPQHLVLGIQAYQMIHHLMLEGAMVLSAEYLTVLNQGIADMFKMHGKQKIVDAMTSLDEEEQMALLEQCLLEDNYLGRHFWENRIPGTSCDLNKGTLGQIRRALCRLRGEEEPQVKPSLLDRAIRFFSPTSIRDKADYVEMKQVR